MGVDPNFRFEVGVGYNTAMYFAVKSNNTEVVRLLLDKGVDVNTFTAHYNGPVIFAALSSAEMVDFLLSKGANPNSRQDQGNSLLMEAVTNSNGSLSVIKILVTKGANVNYKNNQSPGASNTALKIAKNKGFKEIERFLASSGARE